MVLNNNDTTLCVESSHAHRGSMGEIDLYPQLLAFEQLSPDEQSQLLHRSSSEQDLSTPITSESTSRSPELAMQPGGDEGDKEPALEQPSENAPFLSGELETKSTETPEPVSHGVPPVSQSQSSAPLEGFNLPQEAVYTGAMSLGVCLACGGESEADDLFCSACEAFDDEGASRVPSTAMCKVCNHRIDPGEIFCSWCGSSATA